MRMLMASVFVVAVLAGACDDDDDTPNIDAAGGVPDGGGGGTTFDVAMSDTLEVPECASAGAEAMGFATVVISDDDTTIDVELAYSGLSGPATAAHIHAGAAGEAGPPIFPFDSVTSPQFVTFTAADYPSPPPAGAPADFAAAVASMRAGGTYINVHTAACPMGEIRGQIQ